MKFTRPISREVEISGETFVVTLDDTGIVFRLKGKRRSTNVDWQKVFSTSSGEGGEAPNTYLGLRDDSGSRDEETQETYGTAKSAAATSNYESGRS